MIALSVGAYFITDLSRLQESIATHEAQAALQGITDLKQIDEELRRHPSNRILQLIAMATKAANETNAATEKLLNEVEPLTLSKDINFEKASRNDLDALRRDLKTAETNTTTFMSRYIALVKTERDKVESDALTLHAGKDIVGRFLDGVDKHQAKITALTSETISARTDYYRAYGNYVAVLFGEFGTYKVVDGQFVFPFPYTVNRYNVAAHAMSVAAKRVAELEEERKKITQSLAGGWEQLVNSK